MNNDPNQISSSSDTGNSGHDEANSSSQSADGSSSNVDTASGRSVDEGDESSSSSTTASNSSGSKGTSKKSEELDFSKYQDYSELPPLPSRNAATLAQANARKEPTFPVKLHMILSNKDLEDIICWLPHGRSWRILQQKRFELQVIPHYFTHGRYASFARQVNVWGFKRVIHGADYGSYYHPLFLRGIPHLTGRMRRLTQKAVAKGLKSQLESGGEHIDFFAMTEKHPLPESVPLSLAADGTVHPASASAAKEEKVEATCLSALGPISEIAELVSIEKRRNELLKTRGEGSSSGDSRKPPPVDPAQDLSQAPILAGSTVDPEVLIQTVLMLASKLPNGLFSLLEIIQPLARQEQMLRQNGGTIPGSNVHVVQPPTQNSLSLESVLQALGAQDNNSRGASTIVPIGGGRNERPNFPPLAPPVQEHVQQQPPQNNQNNGNNADDGTLRLLASLLSGNGNGSNQH